MWSILWKSFVERFLWWILEAKDQESTTNYCLSKPNYFRNESKLVNSSIRSPKELQSRYFVRKNSPLTRLLGLSYISSLKRSVRDIGEKWNPRPYLHPFKLNQSLISICTNLRFIYRFSAIFSIHFGARIELCIFQSIRQNLYLILFVIFGCTQFRALRCVNVW